MKSLCRIAAVTLALILGSAASSSATPIGLFGYDVLGAGIGPVFRIDNLSDIALAPGFDFSNIVIQLFDGAQPLADMYGVDPDPIAPSTTSYTLSDLSSLTFDSALLTFSYSLDGGSSFLTASASLGGLTLDVDQSETNTIDVTLPDATPVPEPATLILTTLGTGLVALRRRIVR